MTEEEAKAAVEVAEQVVRRLRALIDDKVRAARAEIEAAHREATDAASAAAMSARATLQQVKDATPDHPWTGKRVFKMVRQGRSYENRPAARIDGVVETVRSQTPFPANTGLYSRPPVGAPLVRLLTKDGSPGVRFDSMRGDYHGWKLAEEET